MNTVIFSKRYSRKMRVRLTLLVLLLTCLSASAQQQIPNMNFDQWSQKGRSWNPWAPDTKAPAWDTANHGLSLLGINGCSPEYEHVAVPGTGKAAAKIETKKVLGILVAGTIFTGKFIKVVRMSGAQMSMGYPFHGRPRSLSGYIHYIPGRIDTASDNYKHLKGTTDIGRIEISLEDWDGPLLLDSTTEEFKHTEEVPHPHRIGHGVLDVSQDTGGYIPFEIPIEYVNGKMPSYIVIVASASRYAQHFTGSTGSIMYIDEFKLNY